MSVLSALLFIFVGLLAARRVDRTWREEPPSERMLWWERTFCTPIIWLTYFRRMMRNKLERNPIGWLEQRTWSGRLVTWSWFAVTISFLTFALTDTSLTNRNVTALFGYSAWLLAGTIAFTASGSFRRERETGVLELLLVSPVSVGGIISGRVRGLWGQFLPAIIVLLVVWLYAANLFNPGTKSEVWDVLFFGSTFLTLPVIGLYFSLRCNNFISALLVTLSVALVLPISLGRVVAWCVSTLSKSYMYGRADDHPSATFFTMVVQFVCAAYVWKRLHRNLTRRTFALDRAIT